MSRRDSVYPGRATIALPLRNDCRTPPQCGHSGSISCVVKIGQQLLLLEEEADKILHELEILNNEKPKAN